MIGKLDKCSGVLSLVFISKSCKPKPRLALNTGGSPEWRVLQVWSVGEVRATPSPSQLDGEHRVFPSPSVLFSWVLNTASCRLASSEPTCGQTYSSILAAPLRRERRTAATATTTASLRPRSLQSLNLQSEKLN